MARLCRINCEQQGISYFRFSPEIGEDVGTTEKDNRKLCEIIIRYNNNQQCHKASINLCKVLIIIHFLLKGPKHYLWKTVSR